MTTTTTTTTKRTNLHRDLPHERLTLVPPPPLVLEPAPLPPTALVTVAVQYLLPEILPEIVDQAEAIETETTEEVRLHNVVIPTPCFAVRLLVVPFQKHVGCCGKAPIPIFPIDMDGPACIGLLPIPKATVILYGK